MFLYTRRMRVEVVTAQRTAQALGHLAAAGIAGAQEED